MFRCTDVLGRPFLYFVLIDIIYQYIHCKFYSVINVSYPDAILNAPIIQTPEDNPFSNIVKETKEYIGYHVDILQWDGHCVILVFEDNVYGWQIVCWLWSSLSPAVITLDSLTPDTPVGPDNGIIWTNVRIVLIEPLGKNSYIFIEEYVFENAACKLTFNSSKPQCVNRWTQSIYVDGFRAKQAALFLQWCSSGSYSWVYLKQHLYVAFRG